MKRQSNAMIGHAVVGEIVGANFFFAAAGADLAAALGTVFFGFLALLSLQQACPQYRQCSLLVLDLTATILTTDDYACWNMQNLHGRVGRIHALTTRTAGARDFNSQ